MSDVRPEAVQAYLTAWTDVTVENALALQTLNLTPAEIQAGQQLVAATADAEEPIREQAVEVWAILESAGWRHGMTWNDVVALLSDADREALVDRYLALPDPLRALLAESGGV